MATVAILESHILVVSWLRDMTNLTLLSDQSPFAVFNNKHDITWKEALVTALLTWLFLWNPGASSFQIEDPGCGHIVYHDHGLW